MIDDIDLSLRHVGDVIDVSSREAQVLIAEGWAEPAHESAQARRILVIEDDTPLREYYRAGLAARFLIDECADGLAALAYFDRLRPDAVVLDLNLPRLHGWTLYNELRRQPLTADLPVVVVTGIDPTPTIPGAFILRKPCEVDVIALALELALAS